MNSKPFHSIEIPIDIDIDTIFRLTASDIMSKKASVLYPATRVSSIMKILKTNAHNAFPVVTVKDKCTDVSFEISLVKV